jgi:Zn-dependent M16 (insulinase) family peptidase
LEKFQDVTREDVLSVMKTYFLPLFDANSSVCVTVAAPGKVEEIAAALISEGFEVDKKSLEIDPDEMEESDYSDEESESGSERS